MSKPRRLPVIPLQPMTANLAHEPGGAFPLAAPRLCRRGGFWPLHLGAAEPYIGGKRGQVGTTAASTNDEATRSSQQRGRP